MKIIKKAEIKNNKIDILNNKYDIVIGKHALWIPELGMKIINSFNGKIEPYHDWRKGLNKESIKTGTFNNSEKHFDFESQKSIISEYEILKYLQKNRCSPKIGESFYIENFVSDFPYGYKYCDCKGRYGYFMDDANKSENGNFNLDYIMKNVRIKIPSKRTIGDIIKEKNIVNGCLIDVRRTIWDMMYLNYSDSWFRKKWRESFEYKQSKELLEDRIKKLTQFPHKNRKQNYQTYFIDGKWQAGSRDTLYRFDQMKIDKNLSEKSIVDLGCQLGSVLTECWNRGSRLLHGYDNEFDYIDCARDLARYNAMNINFLEFDITKDNLKFDRKIDIVFALSLYKHVGEKLFELLKSFDWDICYVESNAIQNRKSDQAKEIEDKFRKYNYDFEFIEFTEDRSKRAVWKIYK